MAGHEALFGLLETRPGFHVVSVWGDFATLLPIPCTTAHCSVPCTSTRVTWHPYGSQRMEPRCALTSSVGRVANDTLQLR